MEEGKKIEAVDGEGNRRFQSYKECESCQVLSTVFPIGLSVYTMYYGWKNRLQHTGTTRFTSLFLYGSLAMTCLGVGLVRLHQLRNNETVMTLPELVQLAQDTKLEFKKYCVYLDIPSHKSVAMRISATIVDNSSGSENGSNGAGATGHTVRSQRNLRIRRRFNLFNPESIVPIWDNSLTNHGMTTRAAHQRTSRAQLSSNELDASRSTLRSNASAANMSIGINERNSRRPIAAGLSRWVSNIHLRHRRYLPRNYDDVRMQNLEPMEPSSSLDLIPPPEPNDLLRKAISKVLSEEATEDCIICFCPKTNPSVLTPCLHLFCYGCINRWISIKPTCPLCKAMGRRILHHVRSQDDYSEDTVHSIYSRSHSSVMRDETGSDVINATMFMLRVNEIVRKNLSYARSTHLTKLTRYLVYMMNLRMNNERTTYVSGLKNNSPAFYSQNEAEVFRIFSFVKRELEVIAPWLCYMNASYKFCQPSSININYLLENFQLLNKSSSPLIDIVCTEVVKILCSHPIEQTMTFTRQLTKKIPMVFRYMPQEVINTFVIELFNFSLFDGTMEQYYNTVNYSFTNRQEAFSAIGNFNISVRMPRSEFTRKISTWIISRIVTADVMDRQMSSMNGIGLVEAYRYNSVLLNRISSSLSTMMFTGLQNVCNNLSDVPFSPLITLALYNLIDIAFSNISICRMLEPRSVVDASYVGEIYKCTQRMKLINDKIVSQYFIHYAQSMQRMDFSSGDSQINIHVDLTRPSNFESVNDSVLFVDDDRVYEPSSLSSVQTREESSSEVHNITSEDSDSDCVVISVSDSSSSEQASTSTRKRFKSSDLTANEDGLKKLKFCPTEQAVEEPQQPCCSRSLVSTSNVESPVRKEEVGHLPPNLSCFCMHCPARAKFCQALGVTQDHFHRTLNKVYDYGRRKCDCMGSSRVCCTCSSNTKRNLPPDNIILVSDTSDEESSDVKANESKKPKSNCQIYNPTTSEDFQNFISSILNGESLKIEEND